MEPCLIGGLLIHQPAVDDALLRRDALDATALMHAVRVG